MMRPVVSVIILTYNQEKYIEQSIVSVLNQKCDFPFEIVIGEDCSTDKTLEICKDYQQRYPSIIKLLANSSNKGVINNYFDALLASSGKYIADCAGDDYWIDSYKLQRQVNILEEYPKVALTYTNYRLYIQSEDRFEYNAQQSVQKLEFDIHTYDRDAYKLLNQTNKSFVFLCTSCFRKDIFMEVYTEHEDLFRNKKYTCEDFQLLFSLLRKGDFYYENKETTVYRIISESVSHTKNYRKQFNYSFGIFLLRTDLISYYNLDVVKCSEFLSTRLRELLSLCILLNIKKERKELLSICNKIGYKLTSLHKSYVLIGSSKVLSFLFRRLK